MQKQIGSQRLPQQEDDQPHQQQTHKASCGVIAMISYLYFAQGFVLSIPGTMTIVYPQLPDYFTLSLFSLSALPFSFKFLTAPILQKYYSLTYGKRKTWIITSQLLTNLMTFTLSFFTSLQQASVFALLSFFMLLGLSLQDIALDSLCLKQLKSPRMMSMIQSSFQSSGVIIGSFALLKGSSMQFAQSIGLQSPLTSPRVIFIGVSIFLLIPTLLIHFLFRETFLQTQLRSKHEPLLKVYSVYRYFFKPDYRYFWVLVYSLIYYQGFNFFGAGYGYQLIQAGFSRDKINDIDNITNIVITVLTFLVGYQANFFGYRKSFIIQLTITLLISIYLRVVFPTELLPIIITNFISSVLSRWDFLLTSILIADFPDHGVTGMMYTMGASGNNFGKNTFIHTAILKKVPWSIMSIVGLGLQLILNLAFVPVILGFINKAKTDIQILNQPQPEMNQLELNNQNIKATQTIK